MKRGRSTWVLGGGALLLVVVLAVPAPRRDEPTPGTAAANGVHEGGDALAAVTTPEQLEAQRTRTRSTEWGRDPFTRVEPAPTNAPAVPASADRPRLQGISRSGTSWMALIDGQLVEPGARLVTGQTVLEITRTAVTLRRDGADTTLELGETR